MKIIRRYILPHEMETLVREEVQLHKSQKEAAKSLGVSPQYLNDIARGRRDVSGHIAKMFGWRKMVIFVPDNGGDDDYGGAA